MSRALSIFALILLFAAPAAAQPEPANGPGCQYLHLYMGDTCRGEMGVDQGVAQNGDMDAWAFWADEGDTVTVTLRARDFDPQLVVGIDWPGRWEELGTGEGTGSDRSITFRVPSKGLVTIRVTGTQPGAAGVYHVSVHPARPAGSGTP